jgi:hypothetical protein
MEWLFAGSNLTATPYKPYSGVKTDWVHKSLQLRKKAVSKRLLEFSEMSNANPVVATDNLVISFM